MKTSAYLLPALAALAIVHVHAQGPLTPPGAPAPTMKTLDQIEPRTPVDLTHTPGDATSQFIISQPGSYYLTGNVAGVSGKNGIKITADHVTLDLNGFAVVGVSGSLTGILTAGSPRNLRVANGVVRGWGGEGVNATNSYDGHFEQLRAESNAGSGIVGFQGSIVINCQAVLNGGDGIYVGFCSTVIGCYADTNTGSGIDTGGNGTVAQCTATRNTGLAGIFVNDQSTVAHCTGSGNSGYGILLNQFSTATGCTASSNGSHGIFVNSQHCVIDHCTMAFNRGDGINIPSYGKGNRITGCVVSGSGSPAVPTNGIVAGASAFIDGCSITANNATGISAGVDCKIAGCHLVNNAGDGILAGDRAHVSGNEVTGNGTTGVRGGGIHITGNFGRIEANQVSTNKKDGLLLDNTANGGAINTTGNFVFGNTARNNTDFNYRITGNEVGPFQTMSTATSPFANFQ